MVASGAALVGVGYVPMAVAPDIGVAILGAAIAGVGNGVEIVAARTALQEAAPDRWMALMLSLNESMFQAMPGIGIAMGGAITALGGPRTALGAGAVGALTVALTMWLALTPSATRDAEQEEVARREALDATLTAAGPGQ